MHDLVLVRDYIGRNHEFAEEGDVHSLELTFRCTLQADQIPANGPKPDKGQVGVEWLDLDALASAPLYPKVLRSILPALDKPHSIYLGDVN